MKKQAVYNKQVCYVFTHRTTLKLKKAAMKEIA